MLTAKEALSRLRWPSFRTSFFVSLAMLFVFSAWIVYDASYDSMIEILRFELRIKELPGPRFDLRPSWQFDALGSRLLCFVLLAAIAAASTFTMFARLCIGKRSGRSISAMLAAVANLGLWLSLVTQYGYLRALGAEHRIYKHVPQLREITAVLSAQWPTATVDIEGFGVFKFEATNPKFLLPPHSAGYAWSELFGTFIRRLDNGAIVVDLADDVDARYEYHPGGSSPSNFDDVFPNAGLQLHYRLVSVQSLGDNAYVTRYEFIFKD